MYFKCNTHAIQIDAEESKMHDYLCGFFYDVKKMDIDLRVMS
jgi:hypothetical protein